MLKVPSGRAETDIVERSPSRPTRASRPSSPTSRRGQPMNESGQGYLDVVRRLPAPTVGQTMRFARFVSMAHSWYKHLPIRPKVPFVFYLDPARA